jgi:hypothetical protein
LYVTDTEKYGTLYNLDYLSVTVPPSFVQVSIMPKRTDSCLRNKYTKKRKISRTPIVIPRIIDHFKDANPHLDQVNSLTVITMDLEVAPLAVSEPVPGAPEITQTEVCSNFSPIKHQKHPKPNHASGGEEESYIFSARVHKQSLRMPMAARTT